MIKPVNGYELLPGELVGMYRNLATKDPARQVSVKQLTGVNKGKKIAEGDSVTLINCGAFVRLSTRNRLVAAKAAPGDGKGNKGFREVHAWITGHLLLDDVLQPDADARRVSYDPFVRDDFYFTDNGDTFTSADAVTFNTDARCYVVNRFTQTPKAIAKNLSFLS